jgi:hypothetical protein
MSGRAWTMATPAAPPSAETNLVIQSILATFLCRASNGPGVFSNIPSSGIRFAIVSPSELSGVQCPQYMK